MGKDRFVTFRIDPRMYSEFEFFSEHRKISNQSLAARHVFKLGLQCNRLLIGKDTTIQSDLEMETVIDSMTEDQKVRLFEMLTQKLGRKEVDRLVQLADLK